MGPRGRPAPTHPFEALAAGNDASFSRVTRPEVGLPEGTDEHADEVYAQGKRALAARRERGVLQGGHAGLWLYGQRLGDHRQVGLVACVPVDEYDRDLIKKHEKTRPDKEDDRARHIDVLAAHDEPVFLAQPRARRPRSSSGSPSATRACGCRPRAPGSSPGSAAACSLTRSEPGRPPDPRPAGGRGRGWRRRRACWYRATIDDDHEQRAAGALGPVPRHD